jgi:hypothetical protein
MCPHCHQATISAWRKLFAVESFPARCPTCGNLSCVKVGLHDAWIALVAVAIGALFATGHIVFGALGSLALICASFWRMAVAPLAPTNPKRVRPWRYAVVASWMVLALVGTFAAGEKFGEHFAHQQFELFKEFSVVQADEYLAAKNYEKAIPILHFSKAFDRIRGSSDAMLAEAYLGNGEPCLAQAFADSHLRYMERNKLTSFSSYASTQDLYDRASWACADLLRPFPPPASATK